MPAAKVHVNIAGGANAEYAALPGEESLRGKAGRFAYRAGTDEPLKLGGTPVPALARLQRTTGPAPASDPKGQPERPPSGLAGQELYRLNCAACHGLRGEGNTGKPLAPIVREGGARAVMSGGRPLQRMPSWGHVLAPEELSAIAEYLEGLVGK